MHYYLFKFFFHSLKVHKQKKTTAEFLVYFAGLDFQGTVFLKKYFINFVMILKKSIFERKFIYNYWKIWPTDTWRTWLYIHNCHFKYGYVSGKILRNVKCSTSRINQKFNKWSNGGVFFHIRCSWCLVTKLDFCGRTNLRYGIISWYRRDYEKIEWFNPHIFLSGTPHLA